jgi:UTP--glucose-1-phosphate uridylyltransferase
VGNESFVVALGDTIIKDVNEGSLLTKMMEVHRQTQAKCTLAVEEVSEEEVYKYGVVTPGKGGSRGVFPIKDIIEKPKIEKAPSNLAVASRYVFEPEIFAALKKTLPDHRGEIQLTDAIKILLTQGYLVEAVKLEEGQVRYDIGTHESYFRAFIDFALADKKYGYTVRQYLTKKLASF